MFVVVVSTILSMVLSGLTAKLKGRDIPFWVILALLTGPISLIVLLCFVSKINNVNKAS